MSPRRRQREQLGPLDHVHHYGVESRLFVVKDDSKVRVTIERYRVVCSCGWASQWKTKPGAPMRVARLHAIDGQLSLGLDQGDDVTRREPPR